MCAILQLISVPLNPVNISRSPKPSDFSSLAFMLDGFVFGKGKSSVKGSVWTPLTNDG